MAKISKRQNAGQSTSGIESSRWRVKREKVQRIREGRQWAERSGEVGVCRLVPEELARRRAERVVRE